MRIFIELHAPRLPSERREFTGPYATLGSGENDTFRIPEVIGLPVRAYEIRCSEAGVEISAGPDAPNVSHEGRSFRSAHVPLGDEVFLGSVRVAFTAGEALSESRPKLPLIAAVGLLAALSLGLALTKEQEGRFEKDIPAPRLFPETSECSPPSTTNRSSWTEGLIARAKAKSDRFAFSRRDGVSGVLLAAQAASCATRDGDTATASLARGLVASLGERVEDEYQSLQLRLRSSREQKRYGEALATALALDEMLDEAGAPKNSPFRTRLGSIKDALNRQLDKKK